MKRCKLLLVFFFLSFSMNSYSSELINLFSVQLKKHCHSANSLLIKKVLILFLKSHSKDEACQEELVLSYLKNCDGSPPEGICSDIFIAYQEIKSSFSGSVIGAKR